jgi:hypothetical protein
MKTDRRTTRRGFIKSAGLAVGSLPLVRSAFAQAAQRPPTGFLYDPLFLKHNTGEGHPESPARLTAIEKGLTQTGLMEKLARIQAEDCPLEILQLVHTADYIKLVRHEGDNDSRTLSTGDAQISRDSYAGNTQDPLSLHKYLYAAVNPTMNVDPSGQLVGTLIGVGIDLWEAGQSMSVLGSVMYVIGALDVDSAMKTMMTLVAAGDDSSLSWGLAFATMNYGNTLMNVGSFYVSAGLAAMTMGFLVCNFGAMMQAASSGPAGVGTARENYVANLISGKSVRMPVTVPGLGSTDIDVIGPAGEFIGVGGPAKAMDLAKFGRQLQILKAAASLANTPARMYLERGTPQSAIDLAIKWLGAENVVIF